MTTSGLVTIVFTDLVGSTELSQQLGDNAADELRRTHFQVLRDAVAATGGIEVKTIGDALMVSYSSAADAVAGAVAMQQAVSRQGRIDGRPLEMRVGMSAGDATFEDGDWFGTPVVEAARLCAAAHGGQVLAADIVRVLAGSRTHHTLRAVDDVIAKGISEPIAACEVEWTPDELETEGERTVPLPPVVQHTDVFPFAGRSEQRDVLLDAWKDAATGTRRVLLVSGEPGIGKTRLVKELAKSAHDEGGTVLWGGCDEELGIPYQPITEALRWYVQSATGRQLDAVLGALSGELTRLVPELAHLVPGLAPPLTADADTERFRLFEAVVDLVSTMAARTPVLLVVDDAHWAAKPTLLLLRHVLRGTPSSRLLVVVTYRDTDLDRTHPLADMLADLRREPGVERLALGGLDESAVADFLERTAGHALDEPGMALARALHGETEGNPFFIGEVLLHLAESGILVQRDGRWTSDFHIDEVGIPEGVKEVIGRRLSRLDANVNELLTAAAVVGREFDVGLLTTVADTDQEVVLDALDTAERTGLVTGSSKPGTYRFSHALVSSTLYGELPTSRRLRWHRSIAHALAARSDADQRLPELARHFSEAAPLGEVDKAVEYCRRAGDRARAELAFEEAAIHYERALEALALDDDRNWSAECDLLLATGSALEQILDPRADDAFSRAAELARTYDDSRRFADAAIGVASVNGAGDGTGVDQRVVGLLEEALGRVEQGDLGRVALLKSALAVAVFWSPQSERRHALGEEALDLARRAGDRAILFEVLHRHGWALDLSSGRLAIDTFIADTAEMLAVADDIDEPVLRCRAHLSMFQGRLTLADGDAAEPHLLAAEALAAQLRLPGLTFRAKVLRTARTLLSGRLAEGEAMIADLAAFGQSTGIAYSQPQATLGFRLAYERGQLAELVPLLSGMVESHPAVVAWRVGLASALLQADRPDEVRLQLEALSADDFAMIPRDNLWVVSIAGTARLAGAVGARDIAAAAVEYALAHVDEIASTGQSFEQPVAMSAATALAALGRWDEAEELFAHAIDLSERADAPTYVAATQVAWATALRSRGSGSDEQRAVELARKAMSTADDLGLAWVKRLGERILR